MVTQMSLQKDGQTEKPISPDKVETCKRCGNIYILLWLGQDEDFNDFGNRYCPFCGLLTKDFAHLKINPFNIK